MTPALMMGLVLATATIAIEFLAPKQARSFGAAAMYAALILAAAAGTAVLEHVGIESTVLLAVAGTGLFVRARQARKRTKPEDPWTTARMLLMALGMALYAILGTTVPLLAVRHAVPPEWQLAAAIAAECVVFGVPIAIGLLLMSKSRPIVKREGLAGRVLFLFAFAFVPIALFVIIPALNATVLAGTAGETIGWVIYACAFAALIALWAWARYVWRPRHPEVFERLEHLHERGDS